MRRSVLLLAVALFAWLPATPAAAVEVSIACSALGIEYTLCRDGAQAWAQQTGNRVSLVQTPSLANNRLSLYQQLLAAGSSDIDVFQIDIVWPGTLGAHFIDLRPHVPSAEIARHFKTIIQANTVGGELKALPWYTDVGLLYYRSDLLRKYGYEPPRTWAELAAAARAIAEAERKAGTPRMRGYVFQAKAYEGLTCNALEWLVSHGGGRILDAEGHITLDNARAAAALREAAGWVGGIAPRGVLNYAEEDARGVFQSGLAVFMRNWPYAWPLAQGEDSPVRGKVGLMALPAGPDGHSTGTLGGWSLAVSRYSEHSQAAIGLVRYLTGRAEQRRRAIQGGYSPTQPALYDDPAVLKANPYFAHLRPILEQAAVRPSEVAGDRYNQVSTIFFESVHDVLSGAVSAEDGVQRIVAELKRLRGEQGW